MMFTATNDQQEKLTTFFFYFNVLKCDNIVWFQYLSNVDETPAKMGGKENYWRKLTLDGMSACIQYFQTSIANVFYANFGCMHFSNTLLT